jgi:hypothetical protein
MALNKAFEALTGIQKQMKSVCNLHRLGSSAVGGLSIFAGAVTAYHTEVWVGTKPGLHSGTAAIFEQVHHLVGLQIDDHRAIGLAFPKRKIIQPKLGRVRKSWELMLLQLPTQRCDRGG